MYKTGDLIIYRKPKRSIRPGPRAKNIRPMEHGEEYTYEVDKFWRVVETSERELVMKTPGGKVHRISPNDPHIIKPNFFTSLLMRHRFPVEEAVSS
jgi:hypothetical protein